jgi:hypothetical protein
MGLLAPQPVRGGVFGGENMEFSPAIRALGARHLRRRADTLRSSWRSCASPRTILISTLRFPGDRVREGDYLLRRFNVRLTVAGNQTLPVWVGRDSEFSATAMAL